MFNPGETVIHSFIIPFTYNHVAKVVVTYKQGDDVVFEKTITSGFTQMGNNTQFDVSFSQSESLMFKEMMDYTVQVNVLDTSGSRASSKPITAHSGVQYHKEVIPQ